ncbi:hypothetical protein C8R44DRAFT_613992 [Mycena epipterygia]|nr:hypothetical protein C8R44DRAFT_613992 [Mycena epipterygia]
MVDLGPNYASLMDALIRIEEAQGFPSETRGALTTGRPGVVNDWIQSGRGCRSKTLPKITKIRAYPQVWHSWWDSLQPEWRTQDGEGRWKIGGEYSNDWDVLDCPGPNGLLSVVASIYFWGCESRSHCGEEWFADDQRLWDEAVHDVVWMMDGLHLHLST